MAVHRVRVALISRVPISIWAFIQFVIRRKNHVLPPPRNTGRLIHISKLSSDEAKPRRAFVPIRGTPILSHLGLDRLFWHLDHQYARWVLGLLYPSRCWQVGSLRSDRY